jgi:hypothetical protein
MIARACRRDEARNKLKPCMYRQMQVVINTQKRSRIQETGKPKAQCSCADLMVIS